MTSSVRKANFHVGASVGACIVAATALILSSIQSVLEPGTLLLMGTGLLEIGLASWLCLLLSTDWEEVSHTSTERDPPN